MANRLTIDQDSLLDNDREKQVEFTADIDSDDRDFAVKYAVLREVSATNQTMTPWNCSSGSATRFSISALILPSFGQRPI